MADATGVYASDQDPHHHEQNSDPVLKVIPIVASHFPFKRDQPLPSLPVKHAFLEVL
jgi:hypothetical protein